MIDRRYFMAGGLATLSAAASSNARAQPGLLQPVLLSRLDGVPLAGCTDLRNLGERLKQEAARSQIMSRSEIEKEVGTISDALAKRGAIAAQAEKALSQAQRDLAFKAAKGTVDLVLAACIAQQNTTCIASVYGVKIVADAGWAAVQAFEARTPGEAIMVFLALEGSRIALLRSMVSDLKPKPIHDAAQNVLKRVSGIAKTLASASVAVQEARSDLLGLRAELDRLNSAYAWALINESNYRTFREQHFTAQRWLPDILISMHSSTDCRLDSRGLP